MDTVLSIVSTVGFPIAACIGLAWFVYKFFNELSQQNQQREEKYISIIQEYGTQLKAISENLALMRDDIDELKKVN